ncbi:ATP-binding protein [Niabella ginsengisoli]|uniref:ATP-binding protein n=1 Tax=Niabella ginsengisoli TaxID=522298 RepID=A0ABS9SEZ1_9BACT|nr:ATP-binding protein [Niabella ginsengisoli]MCH5596915.1 ATP-binding protein [Niabella ginsengisoli]
MLQRAIFQKIIDDCKKQKVSLLVGARRVGKTELLLKIKEHFGKDCLWLNGEDADIEQLLSTRTVANYKRLLEGKKLLIIDEAQYITDIGRKVKLMIDEIKPLHIIITGSSSFDLQQNAGEPLVGRSITNKLYPIAQMELAAVENPLKTKQKLEERLIFGSYPEVLNIESLKEKQQYLQELVNTYLLKDILAFENIRNPQKIKDLLILLAHQIGKEVSNEELGRSLGLSKNTVERYLDLLSKVFVIYKRSGYSKNLRKEIVKSSRWYFSDNGVRNALIGNFSFMALRQDVGMLWENYILSERIKYHEYNHNTVYSYFWRTYDQQEIDLIEENANLLNAFEMKWKEQQVKTPVAFEKAYPYASFNIVHQNNYQSFIV